MRKSERPKTDQQDGNLSHESWGVQNVSNRLHRILLHADPSPQRVLRLNLKMLSLAECEEESLPKY